MAIVDYPQDAGTPEQRVGGFYEELEELEKAAEFLGFDVVVPPKAKRGWYMVPASSSEATADRG